MTLRSLRRALGTTAYAWPAVAGVLVLFALNAGFDTSIFGDLAAVLATASPFVLVSMAQAPAVISGNGGLDLSVGPLSGLVSVVIVAGLVPVGLTAAWIVLPVALGIGLLMGAINGVLVSYLRVAPIIATLGSYLFLSGLALRLMATAGGNAPGWLADLSGSVGGVPGVLFLFAGAAVIWLGLQATAYRRNLFAVGGDQRTAFASGVDVSLVRLSAYALSGLLSAIAGLAFTAVLGSADPTVGPPYTLISLAGIALGGITLAGGRGGLLGAAAGGAILFLVQNLLSLAQVSIFELQIVYGAILILALAVNSAADARRMGAGWPSARQLLPLMAAPLLGRAGKPANEQGADESAKPASMAERGSS